MALVIFLVLFTLPLLEIIVIVQAGGAIGWLNVILLTIATAVAGAAIIRGQGLAAMQELQRAMASGEPPVAPVMDGIFLLLAAPFLMTPGFITDGIGFLFLIPPVRYFFARYALRQLKKMADKGKVTIIRR